MDNQTRELLILTLKILRQTVETSHNASEMGLQIWAALRQRDLIGFQEDFEAHTGVSFAHIRDSKQSLIEQLDAAIRRLEK
jgi:hypothetical protein